MWDLMAYSGVYRVKNRNKYRGDPDKVVYRSMWEKYCFMWCDVTPGVKKWSSEEVVVPYYYDVDKRYHRYFVDLLIHYDDRIILIEIKPKKETTAPEFKGRRTKRYLNESLTFIKNQNKWEAAKEYAADRGWVFEIWTEDTLKKMGIMKDRKLPKLKPLPKAKKSIINKRKKSRK